MTAHRFAAKSAGFALAVCVLVCGMAAAQSGRRVPKRSTPEPPAAPAQPAPQPETPPAPPETPKVRLTVAKYVADFNLPSNIAVFVRDECVARLRKTGSVSVISSKDLTRKEAVDLAKSGTETHVLWLQFMADSMDADRSGLGPPNVRNLVLNYVLYEPGSGKTQTQGRIYFDASRALARDGRVLGPYSTGNRGSRGYAPDEAGWKAAEYALDSLGLTQLPTF